MIITVDSNILLSIFLNDSLNKQASALMLKYSLHEFVINDCIYLELGVHFKILNKLDESLNTLEVNLISQEKKNYQGILSAWTLYLKKKGFNCPACKKTIHPICPYCKNKLSFRQRILTDFVIGGFAHENSNGIITLDPTYYKNYFPQLIIFN
jgi:hypothetical protein